MKTFEGPGFMFIDDETFTTFEESREKLFNYIDNLNVSSGEKLKLKEYSQNFAIAMFIIMKEKEERKIKALKDLLLEL